MYIKKKVHLYPCIGSGSYYIYIYFLITKQFVSFNQNR